MRRKRKEWSQIKRNCSRGRKKDPDCGRAEDCWLTGGVLSSFLTITVRLTPPFDLTALFKIKEENVSVKFKRFKDKIFTTPQEEFEEFSFHLTLLSLAIVPTTGVTSRKT